MTLHRWAALTDHLAAASPGRLRLYLAVIFATSRALYCAAGVRLALLRGLLLAWAAYCRPPSQSLFLRENRERMGILNDAFDRLLFGRGRVPVASALGGWAAPRPGEVPVYILLTVGTPLLLLFGVVSAANRGPFHGVLSRPQRLLVAYMCASVLYPALVGNALEVGENNRFRFMTDPFLVVILGLAIPSLARRPRPGAAPPPVLAGRDTAGPPSGGSASTAPPPTPAARPPSGARALLVSLGR